MKKLIALAALLFLPTRAHAIRAIMEQTMASNNVIFIDTQNVCVGIDTQPAVGTALDVNGIAQFGTTAKSSFTAAGLLNMAPGASINLSGSGGYVNSKSSMNAAGFFGDGSNITFGSYNNIALPAANITAGVLGASVVASSAAIASIGTPQLAKTGSSTGTYGSSGVIPSITVGFDGRITNISSNTLATGGLPTISSTTITGNPSTSQTVVGLCVAGSTIAHTSSTGLVWVSMAGGIESETTNCPFGEFVLVDGKQIAPYNTSPYSITTGGLSNGGGYASNASFTVTLNVGAGTHNYCFGMVQSQSCTGYLGTHNATGIGYATIPVFTVWGF